MWEQTPDYIIKWYYVVSKNVIDLLGVQFDTRLQLVLSCGKGFKEVHKALKKCNKDHKKTLQHKWTLTNSHKQFLFNYSILYYKSEAWMLKKLNLKQ
jgi:hypothetical protein